MGYYASGGGTIRLDPLCLPVSRDKLEAWVREQWDSAGPNGDVSIGQDPTIIYVDAWEKYHDDSWTLFLERMEPYTLEGGVEFTGEDSCHWRFIFKNKTFIEQNGRVVYDDV